MWKSHLVQTPRLALRVFDQQVNQHCCVDHQQTPAKSENVTQTQQRSVLAMLLGAEEEQNQPQLPPQQDQSEPHDHNLTELIRHAIVCGNLIVDGNAVRLVMDDNKQGLQGLAEQLVERFTALPFRNVRKKRKQNPQSFPLYGLDGTDFLFPKAAFLEQFAELAKQFEPLSMDASSCPVDAYLFRGQLRDYQQPVVDHVHSMLLTLPSHSALLQADPGAGKTCMLMALAARLQVPCLIMVHNGKLFDQLLEEVPKWLPNAVVGVFRGKKRPGKNCTMCIATVQTLMRRPFRCKELLRFKAVMVDETHHISAQSFSKAMLAVNPVFVLGCTATLQRPDKLDGWVENLIGPLCCTLHADVDADVWPVKFVHEDWQDEKDWTGQNNYVETLTKLIAHTRRTRTIAKIIRKLVQEQDRFVIAVAPRAKICTDLHRILTAAGLDCACCTGDFTTPNYKDSRILVGTTGMLGEGFNDPKRDCCVLLGPYKGPQKVSRQVHHTGMRGGSQLQQICGRSFRGKTKNKPLIVDIQDQNTMFHYAYFGRQRWYRSKTFQFWQVKSITM
jgi:hypothetical protein